MRSLAVAVADLGQDGVVDGVVRMARRALTYVETPALVVAVEHATAPRSPNGVYVGAGVDLAAWAVGDAVRIEPGRLAAPGLTLLWDGRTPRFDAVLAKPKVNPWQIAAALLEALTPGADEPCPVCRLVGGHDLWSRPTTLRALHTLALRSADLPFPARLVDELIGLGRGLTPETDDLVCGAVAAQWARGIRVSDALTGESLADRAAGATTSLSRTWLLMAAEGRVIDPLVDLLATVPASPAWRAALRGLLKIGSTTGRSMLVGATLGMTGSVRRADLAACKYPLGAGIRR